jgi:hypothetical protein
LSLTSQCQLLCRDQPTPTGGSYRENEDLSLIFMVFFLPLSIYLFCLASINRASRAKVVSGVWDIVGLIAALSGFLLIGGPSILSGLYEQWRISWLLGNFQRLNEIRGTWNDWIILYAAYFFGVICLAIWLILKARSKTSVYNVAEPELEIALRRALDDCAIVWKLESSRKLVLFGIGAADEALRQPDLKLTGDDIKVPASHTALLVWRPFQALRHVSLQWTNVTQEIRDNIEERLTEHLARVRAPDNPSASWFFTIGLLLLLFSLLTLGFLIVIRLIRLAS